MANSHCFSSALIWIRWNCSSGAIVFIHGHWWIEQAKGIVFCRYKGKYSRFHRHLWSCCSIICSCYYNKLSSIHFSLCSSRVQYFDRWISHAYFIWVLFSYSPKCQGHYSPLFVLFAIRYSLFATIRCSLFATVRCSLLVTIRYSLFGFSRHPWASNKRNIAKNPNWQTNRFFTKSDRGFK